MADTNARSQQISLAVLTKRKLQVRCGKSKSHVSHVTKDAPKNPEAGRSGRVSAAPSPNCGSPTKHESSTWLAAFWQFRLSQNDLITFFI
jgi:hypothetical protein